MRDTNGRAETSHIEPLTALRFAAAMWVVLYHYWPKLAGTGERAGLIAQGYLGVEVFFVLSGFILCHVYLGAVEAGRFRYGAFMKARFARVYPLHLFTLTGVGALAGAAALAGMSMGDGVVSWEALPANLLMVHAWGLAGEAAWNHPSWSISAEWFAYLSFPAFAAAAIALRGRPNLAVALAVMLLFGLYAGFQAVTGELLTQATVAWGALRIVPCFAYGCALFLLWRSGALETRMQAMAALAVSTALVGVSAQMGAPDAVTVTAAGGAIFALAGLWSHLPRGAFGGLTGRAAVYLGEVSYSVYMICIPWSLVFVNGAAKAFGLPEERLPLPLWLVFIAAVVPLAAVSHHLIERPARAWLRNLGTNHGKTALEPGLAR